MMPNTTNCPKCSSRMEEGYIVDHWQNAKTPESWVKGRPERSFWTGTKVSGRNQRRVETWRCTRCGYLESYAKVEWKGRLT